MTAILLLSMLIKDTEGCKLKAYKCPAGVWTVGYGQTGPGIGPGTRWTQAQCDERLAATAANTLAHAKELSPILINQSPEKQAAIADFIYNLGEGAYMTSTLKKRVDAGDWAGAEDQIIKWNRCKGKILAGLTQRRIREGNLLDPD